MRREIEAQKARRGPLPPKDAQQLGEQAASLLAETPEFAAVRSLALYAALPDELATRPLFELARREGRSCLLPRIGGSDQLEFYPVTCWGDLRPGRYGVLEPASGARVPLAEVGLVVVPGLAFDRSGGRLGRGGGYYDRALCALPQTGPQRASVFGMAHDWQLMDAVPRDGRDELVDAVVTERRIVRARRDGESGEPGEKGAGE